MAARPESRRARKYKVPTGVGDRTVRRDADAGQFAAAQYDAVGVPAQGAGGRRRRWRPAHARRGVSAILHESRGTGDMARSEEHTSELQSLMRNSYAVFCLNKKHNQNLNNKQKKEHNINV